jgi:hypothetical protein
VTPQQFQRTELVPCGAVELGDILLVPGAELHDDLGGLTAELRVDGTERVKRCIR